MNQLVFIENQQVVTDSLTISEVFRKEHFNVTNDIKNQISKLAEAGEKEWGALNFQETHYQHPQNKQRYPKFNMTEDAFTLVVMSYVTPEAMKMKVRFIQEFKRMRKFIEKQEQQSQDPVELALQTSLMNYQEIKGIKEDVTYLKDSMRIDGIQQKAIQSAAKGKAIDALGGFDTKAYKALSSKTFRSIWKEFNTYFQLPRYGELPKAKFDEALYFISKWRPSAALEIEIEACNRQGNFRLVD
ncbi:ORF6C domain-containing protein [Solibacillus silvestris]|uniref:ORF6C domain-containing protein n=1 Tax=Solibacillus silvestris TaxID=76853 RepID=UPI003F812533